MDIRLRAFLGGATAVLVVSSVVALVPTAAATPPPPECSQGEEHAGRTPSPSPSPRPSPDNCSSQSEAPRPTPAASASGRATPTTSPTASETSTSDPEDSCSYDIVDFDGNKSSFTRDPNDSSRGILTFVVQYAGLTCQTGTYGLVAYAELVQPQGGAPGVLVPAQRHVRGGSGTTEIEFTMTFDDLRTVTANDPVGVGVLADGKCLYLSGFAGEGTSADSPEDAVVDVAPDVDGRSQSPAARYCNGDGKPVDAGGNGSGAKSSFA